MSNRSFNMNLYSENGFLQVRVKGKVFPRSWMTGVLMMFMCALCSGQRAQVVVQSGHSEDVTSIVFSPDSQLLASGGLDRTIKLWSVASRRELRTLQGHTKSVTSVAFSPDSRTLASGSADTTIKLWSVETGKELLTLQGHADWVWSVAFSPDGQTLASGSGDNTIKLWDVASGKESRTLQGHSNSVRSVAFSPDGQTLASLSADRTIKLWNVGTGKELQTLRYGAGESRTFPGDAYGISSVVFRPDGQTLASGNLCQLRVGRVECDDKAIKLWDVISGKELRTFQGHTIGVTSVAFSPDGQTLASGGGEGTIKLWDVLTGKELRTLQGQRLEFSPGRTLGVNSVTFSPDGRMLASGGMEDGTIRLWEVASGKELHTLQGGKWVLNVLLSTDGQTLAEETQSISGPEIKLWNVANVTAFRTLRGRLAAFSPDGRTLASGSGKETIKQRDYQTIKLWDVASGKELRTLQVHAQSVTSVAFSPDGQTLAGGNGEGAIQLWEVAGGQELRTLQHTESVLAVAFSSDGKRLSSRSSDGTIKLWDVASGRELRTLQGGAYGSMAFSPDGRIVAGKSAERTIKLWEVSSGKELRIFQGGGPVAFSPDGRTLAGQSAEGTIKLWEVASGRELQTLQADTKGIFSIAFSPDGKALASGSLARLKLWDIATGLELCSLIAIAENDWLVVTPDGLFDGSPAAWDRILWRFSENLYDVAPPEVFFNEFYYPGLLAEIFAGKRPHPVKDISRKDRRQPQLNLALVQGTPGNGRITTRNLTVSVSVAEAPADKEHAAGSGAQDVRLFRNGSLVKVWHGDAFALGEKEGCQKQGAGQVVCETAVPVIAGENRFTAYAFNHDNIKSSDAQLTITGAESLKRAGMAYIVAIGINEYGNSQFNLRYAAADARSFADELQRQQTSLKHFNQVKVISLLDKQATKANILDTMKTLAAQVQPEDAVIVYFAGHGTAERDSYYLIPHDLAYKGARAKIDQTGLNTILSHSLSDRELQQAFERIDTANLVLVLDACNSGQALESAEKRRGPMNSKGLAQLAYEKGMYVLTAAESFQAAREASRLGHGLLTYALVEEGLKTSAADTERRDGQVDLREWLDYATQRVPRMQQEAMQQTRDLEHPLVFVEGEEKIKDPARRSLQQPRVFYRREPEAHPLIVARPRSSGVKH